MAITVYGACAVSFMVTMYALESRSRHFIAAFALGCALSSSYGFLAGTWPFGVVEAVWSLIALRRYLSAPRPDPAAVTTGRQGRCPDPPSQGAGQR
jgi:hypothetical protein